MAKYRFSWNKEYNTVYDTETNNTFNTFECVEILNDLYAKYVDEYALRENLQLELRRVENENKKLRCSIVEICDSIEDVLKRNGLSGK